MKRVDKGSFGKLFKTKREQAGFTQREVAAHLGEWYSESYVSNVENGKFEPFPLTDIIKLCRLMNISAEELLWVGISEKGHAFAHLETPDDKRVELAVLLLAKWDCLEEADVDMLTSFFKGISEGAVQQSMF